MTITLQDLPRSTNYSMRAISAANTLSPAFGGPIQRIARKGGRWALDVRVPALAAAGCGMALIADLVRGESETLALVIPEYFPAHPYGAPVCDGVSGGTALLAKGLTPSALVRKGKFLSVIIGGRRYVHLVTSTTTADSSGEATLPIWPPLRLPTVDGDVIELSQPKIEGFVQPGQEWSISRLAAVGADFTIEERA